MLDWGSIPQTKRTIDEGRSRGGEEPAGEIKMMVWSDAIPHPLSKRRPGIESLVLDSLDPLTRYDKPSMAKILVTLGCM